ncbi:MaoC family dehydratase [Variovorax sp. OV700]|jgi:acyl dehydratase|uniref:MaoC family dehydratase n=1 Tax=Variovorax sp. OV700 TaxID=1882826 RepID=UPI0008883133|nr:MaoC family dehydratase [Variovorax sp. OV700]SDH77413.1 Acyl dehydratase [Variovorax sp. OV700]
MTESPAMTHVTLLDWNALQPGDALPPLELPPISRLDLALYCGASGDHNPIHVDIDFAKSAGMPDVFAHGMLSAAWLARLLTNWVPQPAIRSLDVRFAALTHVGERISCTGTVAEKFEREGRRSVLLKVASANANGVIKLSGEALVAWL